jgi:hypothetical protein
MIYYPKLRRVQTNTVSLTLKSLLHFCQEFLVRAAARQAGLDLVLIYPTSESNVAGLVSVSCSYWRIHGVVMSPLLPTSQQ